MATKCKDLYVNQCRDAIGRGAHCKVTGRGRAARCNQTQVLTDDDRAALVAAQQAVPAPGWLEAGAQALAGATQTAATVVAAPVVAAGQAIGAIPPTAPSPQQAAMMIAQGIPLSGEAFATGLSVDRLAEIRAYRQGYRHKKKKRVSRRRKRKTSSRRKSRRKRSSTRRRTSKRRSRRRSSRRGTRSRRRSRRSR